MLKSEREREKIRMRMCFCLQRNIWWFLKWLFLPPLFLYIVVSIFVYECEHMHAHEYMFRYLEGVKYKTKTNFLLLYNICVY